MHIDFLELLEAVAEVHGIEPSVLLRVGRQRSWISARAMLVYFGREWSGMKAQVLAKKLQRDTSVLSPLYGRYKERRDPEKEKKLTSLLNH